MADLIHFVINGRLQHALMLVGHINDFLQIQMRQKMFCDLIAEDGAVAGEVIHQQADRQAGDNLFVQHAQRIELRALVFAWTQRLLAQQRHAGEREQKQQQVHQQRPKQIMQRIHHQAGERHAIDQLQRRARQGSGDLQVGIDDGDLRALAFFLTASGGQRSILAQLEVFDRHVLRRQIVDRQVEGDHRCQMARLVKGGAQGKVVVVLKREMAQWREAFALVQRVGLLQHLGATAIHQRTDGALFIARRHILQRQRRDHDQAVVLTVKEIHRPGRVFRAPQRIEVARHAHGHIERAAVVRTEDQRFGFAASFFQIVDVRTQPRLLQAAVR